MLVIGCIEAKFCKKICVGKLSPRSTQCTPLHRFGIESQKTRKTMGGKRSWSNPGKNGQEKLIGSCNSLPSATLAREQEQKPCDKPRVYLGYDDNTKVPFGRVDCKPNVLCSDFLRCQTLRQSSKESVQGSRWLRGLKKRDSRKGGEGVPTDLRGKLTESQLRTAL